MLVIRNQGINFSRLWIILLLVMGSILIAFLTVFGDFTGGVIIPVAIIGLSAVLLIVTRYSRVVYFLFFLSTFMFYILRTLRSDFPLGIGYDLLIVLAFIALLFSREEKPDWSTFLNPVTWAFFALIGYHLIEVFNPNGSMVAWAVSLRKNVMFLLYIVIMQMILLRGGLRKLTILWFVMAFLVALYGIYQEWFGLPEADRNYIYSDPNRLSIYFVWGKMRKFSFLSDPSSYGLYMAFTALATFILTIRLSGIMVKGMFGMLTGILLVAMLYSGTRTAYAMFGMGIMFYFLLTLRSRRTLAVAGLMAMVAGGIMFGPFYGWQLNRIRSAFSPSDDPSMGVRDSKRLQYQPYVQSHPIGGGVYTTAYYGNSFAPWHEFAGFDPDSGYLETAMESGWIGLIILMAFVITVVFRGINSYFNIRDPNLRTFILIYLVPFFALSVAHYAQNAMFAKPVDLVMVICLAVMAQAPKLKEIKNQSSVESKIQKYETNTWDNP